MSQGSIDRNQFDAIQAHFPRTSLYDECDLWAYRCQHTRQAQQNGMGREKPAEGIPLGITPMWLIGMLFPLALVIAICVQVPYPLPIRPSKVTLTLVLLETSSKAAEP